MRLAQRHLKALHYLRFPFTFLLSHPLWVVWHKVRAKRAWNLVAASCLSSSVRNNSCHFIYIFIWGVVWENKKKKKKKNQFSPNLDFINFLLPCIIMGFFRKINSIFKIRKKVHYDFRWVTFVNWWLLALIWIQLFHFKFSRTQRYVKTIYLTSHGFSLMNITFVLPCSPHQ